MAQSTALRQRQRIRADSSVLLDAQFSRPQLFNFRVLTGNAVIVNDGYAAKQVKVRPGDKITSMTDSTPQEWEVHARAPIDFISLTDAIIKSTSKRKMLSDFLFPKDDGTITTDRVSRYKILPADTLVARDFFNKTVTTPPFSITNRVLNDNVSVVDSLTKFFIGTTNRILTSSLTCVDLKYRKLSKAHAEFITTADSAIPHRTYCRLMVEDYTTNVTDYVFVLSPEIYNVVLFDSIQATTNKKVSIGNADLFYGNIKFGIKTF